MMDKAKTDQPKPARVRSGAPARRRGVGAFLLHPAVMTGIVAVLGITALLLFSGGGRPEGGIRVQHVLIAFDAAPGFRDRGGPPAKARQRSYAEAEALAQEILERARKGEDFDQLVRTCTDDEYPGIYGIVDTPYSPTTEYRHRSRMAEGFGDTSFALKPGEVGLAVYHAKKCPFGWHIIKRLD